MTRGLLRKGFYISKKDEKVYVANIKNEEIYYSGSKGRGARRFNDEINALRYLIVNNLHFKHKVIHVR